MFLNPCGFSTTVLFLNPHYLITKLKKGVKNDNKLKNKKFAQITMLAKS